MSQHSAHQPAIQAAALRFDGLLAKLFNPGGPPTRELAENMAEALGVPLTEDATAGDQASFPISTTRLAAIARGVRKKSELDPNKAPDAQGRLSVKEFITFAYYFALTEDASLTTYLGPRHYTLDWFLRSSAHVRALVAAPHKHTSTSASTRARKPGDWRFDLDCMNSLALNLKRPVLMSEVENWKHQTSIEERKDTLDNVARRIAGLESSDANVPLVALASVIANPASELLLRRIFDRGAKSGLGTLKFHYAHWPTEGDTQLQALAGVSQFFESKNIAPANTDSHKLCYALELTNVYRPGQDEPEDTLIFSDCDTYSYGLVATDLTQKRPIIVLAGLHVDETIALGRAGGLHVNVYKPAIDVYRFPRHSLRKDGDMASQQTACELVASSWQNPDLSSQPRLSAR